MRGNVEESIRGFQNRGNFVKFAKSMFMYIKSRCKTWMFRITKF